MKGGKFIFAYIIFISLIFLNSCSNENLVGVSKDSKSKGSVALKINNNAPSEVQQLTAFLSRSGYDTLETSISINNDSLNVLSFEAVPIGNWHLLVVAKNLTGKIIYSGEADITIIEDETIDVYLTLASVGSGTGSIKIFIDWANKWTDYQSNPLLISTLDSSLITNAAECKILLEDNVYKMWFQSSGYLGNGIWYAESNNGINWTLKQNHPVVTAGNSGSWDDKQVIVGAVLKDESNYKLYYSGWQDQYSTWQIGLAVSSDGINWEKNSTPVLTAGSEFQVGVTDVIKNDSAYYMYYTYRESLNNSYKIALAISVDGIHWTKNINNPIITASESWEGYEISFPTVYIENSTFYMLYQNYTRSSFGMAVSNDGINWEKKGSVFSNNDFHWTATVSYPFIRKLGKDYWLYYTGVDSNGKQLIGLAIKKID